MEDTIIVLRFNDLGQARHALDELKRLDRDRRLQVSAAALVGRSNDGRINAWLSMGSKSVRCRRQRLGLDARRPAAELRFLAVANWTRRN